MLNGATKQTTFLKTRIGSISAFLSGAVFLSAIEEKKRSLRGGGGGGVSAGLSHHSQKIQGKNTCKDSLAAVAVNMEHNIMKFIQVCFLLL